MPSRRKTSIMAGVNDTVVRSKFVACNTVEWVDLNDVRYIRLHDTNILAFYPDGWVTFNSNGWLTPTTKERMNSFGPGGVWIRQDKRVWYAVRGTSPWADDAVTVVYADGMSYHPEHGFRNAGLMPDKVFIKKIRAYAKKVAAAMPLDPPGPGDCWYCGMVNIEGKPLGEASSNHAHLRSHIEEDYIVPSLVANVLKAKGCGYAYYRYAFKAPENDKLHQRDQLYGLSDDIRRRYAQWIYDYLYTRVVDRRKTA